MKGVCGSRTLDLEDDRRVTFTVEVLERRHDRLGSIAAPSLSTDTPASRPTRTPGAGWRECSSPSRKEARR